MKITGVKSMCCHVGVKTKKNDKWKEDSFLYACLKCKQVCDHFFTCEVTHEFTGGK